MSAILTTPVCCSWQFTGKDRWGLIWKRTVAKSQTNATNVTLHPLRQAICGGIWKHTVEKRQVKQMQQMWLCIFLCKRIEDTFRMHSGEKSNKCNQCNYASPHASSLRTHLKTHSGEKSNKCNQCDYACSDTRALRTHLKNAEWRKAKQIQQMWIWEIGAMKRPAKYSNEPITDIQRYPEFPLNVWETLFNRPKSVGV